MTKFHARDKLETVEPMLNQGNAQFLTSHPFDDIISDYPDRIDQENEETESEASQNKDGRSLSSFASTLSNLKTTVPTNKLRIFLLIYMFILQGIPIGLSNSLPLILISNKVSYSDLGTFSLMMWPISLRILWAPLIDSVYVSRFGRRRTWIIPTTFISGIMMVSFSGYINDTVYSGHVSSTGAKKTK
jgi:hypothetical protein